MGEAELFKRLRLDALRDSPDAFGTTYEAAVLRSAESWSEQSDRSAEGNDRATFILLDDAEPIGMGAVYRKEAEENTGELLQVWIAPGYRGTKAAEILLEGLLGWTEESQISILEAKVIRGNDRALKFYLRQGFEITENHPESAEISIQRLV